MAAEKLNKQRVIQILIMLTLLLSAFFWRTIEHMQQQKICTPDEGCQLNFTNSSLDIEWDVKRQAYRFFFGKGVGYAVTSVTEGASINKSDGDIIISLQSKEAKVEIYNINDNEKQVVTLKKR